MAKHDMTVQLHWMLIQLKKSSGSHTACRLRTHPDTCCIRVVYLSPQVLLVLLWPALTLLAHGDVLLLSPP